MRPGVESDKREDYTDKLPTFLIDLRSYSDTQGRFREIPVEIVTLIGSIENSRGREQLYRAQSPQVLERLARRTRFDSITASSAIEDIVLDDDRALEVVRGTTTGPYRDRPEAEFAGYRDAVDYLVAKPSEPLGIPLILHLHRLLMRHAGNPLAGEFKHTDNFIGRHNPDGSRTVIFETVTAGEQTRWHMTELVDRYEQALVDARVPTLPLIAALILDFLAIHPFEDGNGRVARLLTTNELLRHGFGVAKYVSLERRMFDSKNSYYLALRESQSEWHDGEHDLAPWMLYLLRILQDAYGDFERRVAADARLIGATKREQARNYILTQAPLRFRLAQIADALPDISAATIRDALEDLRAEDELRVGRGRSAMWERTS